MMWVPGCWSSKASGLAAGVVGGWVGLRDSGRQATTSSPAPTPSSKPRVMGLLLEALWISRCDAARGRGCNWDATPVSWRTAGAAVADVQRRAGGDRKSVV